MIKYLLEIYRVLRVGLDEDRLEVCGRGLYQELANYSLGSVVSGCPMGGWRDVKRRIEFQTYKST